MTRRELFDTMLETAEKVFDRVELTHGDFRGGSCRIRDERCLFLNRTASLDYNLRIVASHLAGETVDDMYLKPIIREAIDKYTDI